MVHGKSLRLVRIPPASYRPNAWHRILQPIKRSSVALALTLLATCAVLAAAEVPPTTVQSATPEADALAGAPRRFLAQHCYECHDAEVTKGGLNLASASFNPDDARSAGRGATVHDRVRDGEMPPKKKDRTDPNATTAFLSAIPTP
jgi:mono/diheme cytochrome c family protein